MSHFGRSWQMTYIGLQVSCCMFLNPPCGVLLCAHVREGEVLQQGRFGWERGAGAGRDWFFPRASAWGGRCLHNSTKLHKTHNTTHVWHTCTTLTHLEVNTQNTHMTPTRVRDTDPFLSGLQCWYTVALVQRWIRAHSVQEELPFHFHANTLWAGLLFSSDSH